MLTLYMMFLIHVCFYFFFFFQAEDGIRDADVTGVQTCALPISTILPDMQGLRRRGPARRPTVWGRPWGRSVESGWPDYCPTRGRRHRATNRCRERRTHPGSC